MRRVALVSASVVLAWSVAVGLTLVSAGPAAGATTFTVTSTVDTDDGACTTADCTLREAINAANASAGPDAIAFDVGAGVPSIGVGAFGLGALPHVTDPVTIDGVTGGAARVELNGAAAPGGVGLHVDSSSTTVHLVVNRFSRGIVVVGSDDFAGCNVIAGNLIGTDATGTAHLGNRSRGVVVAGSVANTIGPDNVISGNDEGGVALLDAGYATRTADNVIRGNRIGTDVSGTAPLANGRDGVYIDFASRFLVEDNVISGNDSDGIRIASFTVDGFTGDGRVRANRIGTDVTGTVVVPNGDNGILLDRATNTVVGGTGPGDGNLISGNADDGIRIDENFGEPLAPLRNRIQGNRIGTDAAGTADLGNHASGVHVDGQQGNTVGGPGAGNVISGNLLGV